ncbi:hypothetical protein C4577_03245 [Candidatus Parcubacteria bacterium]|nr:MAG: hypothetical protein C4577_03245 [Candidatus Parcubacteria bacterium]
MPAKLELERGLTTEIQDQTFDKAIADIEFLSDPGITPAEIMIKSLSLFSDPAPAFKPLSLPYRFSSHPGRTIYRNGERILKDNGKIIRVNCDGRIKGIETEDERINIAHEANGLIQSVQINRSKDGLRIYVERNSIGNVTRMVAEKFPCDNFSVLGDPTTILDIDFITPDQLPLPKLD